ncbi:hypothetical protein BGX27_008841 [Mortierella sp. AM989]|nr:hypothetical protein BGX27_008841 [Mortierella sp. AM989]
MGNKISSPLCVTANNQSVYLVAYDKDKTDGNLVLLRSNPFPTSLKSAKWELLAQKPAKEVFDNAHWNPNGYKCAASNDGTFMILAMASSGTGEYQYYEGAVADTSSNGWEVVKFGASICLWVEPCEGHLLATPAGSSASFMLVVQRLNMGAIATGTNRTLNFLTYKTGTNLLMEHPTDFDFQRSSNRGDNFEFLGNQFVHLSFALAGEGNTTNYSNTTITSRLFDLDAQGLPNPTLQVSNAALTNLQCALDSRGTLSGTSNGVLYFNLSYDRHRQERTLYSWDGHGALNKMQNFKSISHEQYSFTPVPASEGNASWFVILAEHKQNEVGLFGLEMSLPEKGFWQSVKPAEVSAKGLSSALSTGGHCWHCRWISGPCGHCRLCCPSLAPSSQEQELQYGDVQYR